MPYLIRTYGEKGIGYGTETTPSSYGNDVRILESVALFKAIPGTDLTNTVSAIVASRVSGICFCNTDENVYEAINDHFSSLIGTGRGVVTFNIYLDSTLTVKGFEMSGTENDFSTGSLEGYKITIVCDPYYSNGSSLYASIGFSTDHTSNGLTIIGNGILEGSGLTKSNIANSNAVTSYIVGQVVKDKTYSGSNDQFMIIDGLDIIRMSLINEVEKYATPIVQSETFKDAIRSEIESSVNSVYSKVAGLFIKR